MALVRFSYCLLLCVVCGCAASQRIEDLDRRESLIYSGGLASLYAEQDGTDLGSISSGDTVDVVAKVTNGDTGELLYYLVDRNGARARVRAPLLRRDAIQPVTRIDSVSRADSLARPVFIDGKGMKYYIDQDGHKVYLKEPEPEPKPKAKPKPKPKKGKGKKKR